MNGAEQAMCACTWYVHPPESPTARGITVTTGVIKGHHSLETKAVVVIAVLLQHPVLLSQQQGLT